MKIYEWKNAAGILDKIIPKEPSIKDRVDQVWEELNKPGEVKHLKGGTLIVKLPNSAVLQEMTYERQGIIEIMNEQLDLDIREVKFVF